MRPRFAALVLTLLVPLAGLPSAHAESRTATSAVTRAATSKANSAVIEKRVIGRSVQGRAIRAYRLGEPHRPGVPKVVLIGTMHGDEPGPRRFLRKLIEGRPIVGVDLWIVPTYNPDGYARHTRKNARGVDLNRNYPYRWKDLDGSYESGKRPKSEPETRAMMAFLDDVDPKRILSFHQPLYGVDTRTKRPAFSRRVAAALKLPRKEFSCGSVCHGTMTMWFNHRHDGAAITVEYGRSISRRTVARVPRRLLDLFGAHYRKA